MSSSNEFTLTDCEGTSSTKFFSALDLTCKKFISSVKFSLFKSKYRNIYKKDPEALKILHDQLSTQLKNSISEELNELSKENRIDFLLNTLDAIKKSQDSTQPSWRPSGNPGEDLRDHIYSIKLYEKESLEGMLSKLKVENEELLNIATVNHAEIMHIKKTNDSFHENFTSIISSFTGHNQCLQNAMNMTLDKE